MTDHRQDGRDYIETVALDPELCRERFVSTFETMLQTIELPEPDRDFMLWFIDASPDEQLEWIQWFTSEPDVQEQYAELYEQRLMN